MNLRKYIVVTIKFELATVVLKDVAVTNIF